MILLFFFQAEDGIRDTSVTGVQTCALPISLGDVLLAALALEPLADALLGRGALDEVQPVAARAMRSLRGQDLDDLAVLERVRSEERRVGKEGRSRWWR